MPATFVLQATNEGKARVELWSAQGQRLLSSDLYESKQAARNAVGTIRRAAAEAELVDADQAGGSAKKASGGAKKASGGAKKTTKQAAKKAASKKSTKKAASKKSTSKSTKKSS